MKLFLSILYWLLLVLAVIGFFAPSDFYPRANTVVWIVLFIIIGLSLFKLGS